MLADKPMLTQRIMDRQHKNLLKQTHKQRNNVKPAAGDDFTPPPWGHGLLLDCSSLVKLLPDDSNLFASQITWYALLFLLLFVRPCLHRVLCSYPHYVYAGAPIMPCCESISTITLRSLTRPPPHRPSALLHSPVLDLLLRSLFFILLCICCFC